MAGPGFSQQDLGDKFHLSQDLLDSMKLSEKHSGKSLKIIGDGETLGPTLEIVTPLKMTTLSQDEKAVQLQNIATEMVKKVEQTNVSKATARETLLKKRRADHTQEVCKPLARKPLPLPYSHHQYYEDYPDVCFLGKPVEFTVSSKGGHFASQDYGISLSIPQRDESQLTRKAKKISIQPCVSGLFKYPEGYEPLSAVYLVTLQDGTQNDVELILEHFAKIETNKQAKQMTFLSASTPEGGGGEQVVEFKPISGGKFMVHERHGALQLKQSCYICVGTTESSYTRKYYGVLFSHSRMGEEHDCHYAALGVSLYDRVYMENFKQSIHEEYPNVQFSHQSPQLVEFQNNIANVERLSNLQGWIITADCEPCSFERMAVDVPEWNEEAAKSKYCYPPRYVFTLTPTEEATSCEFQLQLVGMTRDLKFSFGLQYAKKTSPVELKVSTPRHPPLTSISNKLFRHHPPSIPQLLYFPQDNGTVNIIEQIGVHYKMLGPLLLNDDTGAITDALTEEFHRNAFVINFEVLKRWLRGNDLSPVTWETLVAVLKSIGLNELARKIETSFH